MPSDSRRAANCVVGAPTPRHLNDNNRQTTSYLPDALSGRLRDRWSFTCMSAVNSSVIAHTHTWDNSPGMGASPGAFSHFEYA